MLDFQINLVEQAMQTSSNYGEQFQNQLNFNLTQQGM